MRERKKLAVPLTLKSLDESGRFAGYASVFGVVDAQRDIMLRGAFADSIRGRAAQVRLLWQHKQDEPIGYFTEMFEDARGLYVEGRLLPEVARAREALALLKAGALRGLSIGYSPTRYTVDPETGVRRLSAVDLWEVSLVTFPANAQAEVTVVKAKSIDIQMLALVRAVERAIQACHIWEIK
ncbi:MAG: HK97 family phage prohead protease [Alphaproteobacteria bacterium]|nr:HK97 family phage prohead protease [Alphaproteobacteria bacterium]